jgi:hypothetical protein
MTSKQAHTGQCGEAEKTVRDIRRNTCRHHSAEEKIRIVLEGLRGGSALPNSAARKASMRTSITGGPSGSRQETAGWRHGP